MATGAGNDTRPVPPPQAFRRLPNEWHQTPAGPKLPHLSWRSDSSQLADPVRRGWLERLYSECFEGDTPPESALWPALFSACALRLQGTGSPFLAEWLLVHASPERARDGRYPFIDEVVAAEAGLHAARIVLALASAPFEDYSGLRTRADALLGGARQALSAIAPKQSAYRVLAEAVRRGIPVRRHSRTMPVYQLGYGARQRRLWQGFTDATSHIGAAISARKHHTNALLRDHGIPVPAQRSVSTYEQALRAARLLGYPVVVKPAMTDRGIAVSTDIRSDADLLAAYNLAAPHGHTIVERHIPGSDYRMAVIGGRCAAVFRRDPAQIVGDGASTLEALVERQAERRRQDPVLRTFPMPPLDDPLVAETLQRQGIGRTGIPAAGQIVLLRGNANVSTGGSLELVTSKTHPDNILMAERAAACVGLDHAGIDFITPDITRPWHQIDCGVCEVNATPAMFLPGDDRQMVDYLFPDGGDGRIPIVVVVGDGAEADETIDLILDLARASGIRIGSVRRRAASIDGTPVSIGLSSANEALAIILADAGLELAVVQLPGPELLARGLTAPYMDILACFMPDEEAEKVQRSPLSCASTARTVLLRPSARAVADIAASTVAALRAEAVR